MASKRQQQQGQLLQPPFGEDAILELSRGGGNPNFTRGAFGDISIGLLKGSDETYDFVAIKTIEQALSLTAQQEEPKLSREVFNELCALSHLSPHPNIVPLLAYWIPSKKSSSSYALFSSSPTSLSLAFAYAPVDLYLTLEWRRRKCLAPLVFRTIKVVALDLLEALAHCHRLGVLHRDVKPGNLLVSSNGMIVLCDFGLSKPFLEEQRLASRLLLVPEPGATGTKGLCTLFYRPPEVLLGGPANHPAIDLYSAGTVLAELIAGKPLFEGHNVVGQLNLVFDHLGSPSDTCWPGARLLPDYGKLEFAPREPKGWSDSLPRVTEHNNLPEFLDRLLSLDPSKRMTATEALQHPLLDSSGFGNDNKLLTSRESRQKLAQELIPTILQIPPLLAPNNTIVMTRLALDMASKRRTLLPKHLVSWNGAELSTTTLQDMVGNSAPLACGH